MALTKEQWNEAAEKAAAEKFGRNHAGWYTFKRYGMVPTALGAAAAAIGWILYKAWTVVRDMAVGDFAGPPSWSIYCFVGLLLLTAIAYRPGRTSYPSLPLVIVKAIVFVGAWLMLIAATIAAI
jgi:hypothetical protein